MYGAARIGDFEVISKRRLTPSGWAIIVLSVSVLVLGGCGRKGPLDLPPTASNPPPQASTTAQAPSSPTANPLGLLDPNPQDEQPRAAPGRKKRILIDPILD